MALIHARFDTSDPDQALAALRTVYPTVRVQDVPAGGGFRFTQHVDGDQDVTFARIRFGSVMDLASDLTDGFSIVHTLEGRYDNVDTGPSAGPSLWHGAVRSHSEDSRLLVVNVTTAAVERLAAEHLGAETAVVRFHGTAPVSAAAAALWSSVVDFAASGVMDDGEDELSGGFDLVRQQAFRALIGAALHAFPIEVVAGTVRGTGSLPSSVRRAVRFIEDDPGRPMSVADIAAEARMSVRGLQLAFRRHLDTTPLDHLRRARLAAAHEELEAADPGTGATVTEIAGRWGFGNAGRFSRAYREEYGRSPGETLRH
ncbi:helix-turn-helix domain-containing protein [Curtobacterium sp. MCBD17_040]|uniref:AraC family transcriptional regulator n=1 Tax=Curtobacterium sp. MCBD17_040 TaxID=2175674 RepID=UPI000DA9D195|nr:helix-turn-helix domain-containing protein [Curtobacterium sp. MCBD17_040]WIB62684.1 helix-turn-helix domain-containing protein [Curtobacterium sp. MCBD17_040]